MPSTCCICVRRSSSSVSAAAERTFYLVTPKGRALSAAAETLLDDLRTQIQHVEGITWY